MTCLNLLVPSTDITKECSPLNKYELIFDENFDDEVQESKMTEESKNGDRVCDQEETKIELSFDGPLNIATQNIEQL